jgi:hypothetical protein
MESLEDVALVKNRFETDFLPKYRGLWKSILDIQNSKKPATPPPSFGGFMDAIQNKKTISIKIDHGDDCECCVPPVLEWEEQESAHHNNHEVLDETTEDDSESTQASPSSYESDASIQTSSSIPFHSSFGRIESTPLPEKYYMEEPQADARESVSFMVSPESKVECDEYDDSKKTVQVRSESDIKLESNQLENKEAANESNEEYFSTREDISEDEGASKEENDEDESHSSGSTAVHFDIAFVVQSSPNNRQKDERGLDHKLESQEVGADDWEGNDGDSSQSSGNTAVHFDISHVIHSPCEEDRKENPTPGRNYQVPLGQNLFTPQQRTHFSPAPKPSSLDGALMAGFASLNVDHAARLSPICTETDSPNKTSSTIHSKLQHDVVDEDIGEDDEADAFDNDTAAAAADDDDDDSSQSSGDTAVHFDISHIVYSPEKSENDESTPIENSEGNDIESDADDDSSQSSGNTAVHFDISHIVHSPKKDEHGTSTPDENSQAPEDRILFTPQQITNFSPASITAPKPYSLDEELMAGFASLQVGQAAAQTSPVRTYSDSPNQKGSDRKVDSEEIDEDDDDDDTGSQSSGSTAVHFDMSHIVHSSRDKDMCDDPKLSTPIQAIFSSPTSMKAPQPMSDSADRRVLHGGPTSPTRHKAEASTLDKNSRFVDLSDSSSEDEEVFPKAEANTQRLAPTSKPTARPQPTRIQVASGEDTSSEEEEWDGNVSDKAEWIDSSDDEVESKARPDDNIKKQTNQVVTFSDTSDDECSFDSNFSSDEDLENRNPNNLEMSSKKRSLSSKMSKAAFRRNRQSLAEDNFSHFNKAAFGGNIASVEVIWSNKLRTTAGLTRLKKSYMNMRPGIPQERLASIELSTKVLDDPERLRSTLLHEMVHAAAWIIDGVSRPPHGSTFKKWANIAMNKIPDVEVTTTHDYQIQYKYAWVSSTTCV